MPTSPILAAAGADNSVAAAIVKIAARKVAAFMFFLTYRSAGLVVPKRAVSGLLLFAVQPLDFVAVFFGDALALHL
ncbi:MAG TPA: hypothetical protein VM674_04735, partial [Candidatus Acidoferrum sp.]|nr:hypothetical protein [Candidatus Acidoferrum sp.]